MSDSWGSSESWGAWGSGYGAGAAAGSSYGSEGYGGSSYGGGFDGLSWNFPGDPGGALGGSMPADTSTSDDWGQGASEGPGLGELSVNFPGDPGGALGGSMPADSSSVNASDSIKSMAKWGMIGMEAGSIFGLGPLGFVFGALGGLVSNASKGAQPSGGGGESEDWSGASWGIDAGTGESLQDATAAKADKSQKKEKAKSGTTDLPSPTEEADVAEDEKRRRQGFGYLEAIRGEVDPMLSMLWNPNIQLGGGPPAF